MAFGEAELPSSGEASGVLVTASGGTTARVLGEHLAALVNVRDFGAMGDGATDDAAAFQAAIAAAQTRLSPVYVPASPTAYVIGATLTLDRVSMVGEGIGSTLKLAQSSGSALQLMGVGARLSGLRLLGPGVTAPPSGPADVDLSGVSLDGIRVVSGAEEAVLHDVEVIGCASRSGDRGRGRGDRRLPLRLQPYGHGASRRCPGLRISVAWPVPRLHAMASLPMAPRHFGSWRCAAAISPHAAMRSR